MSIEKTKLTELRKYFDAREQQLFDCFAGLDNHLDDQIQEIINPTDGSTFDPKDAIAAENIWRIRLSANTFRYSMLVAVCTFHEEVMVAIAKLAVVDYATKLKALKGNWIVRHTSLLTSECGIDFATVSQVIEKMEDLWTIRNCVVHAWGNASKVFDRPKLQAAVERINKVTIPCVEFTQDDELYFHEHDIVSIALTTGDDVVHHLLHELS